MATYTKVYNNPYPDGWKDGKGGKTPVTADILNNQTETLESIEQYLADNPIEQGGSGETGTTDYNDLTNKPRINGVEVVGDLTAEDLGLSGGGSGGTTDYEALNNLPSIENVELKGNVTLAELGTKKQIRISWTDYQALSTEEKNDFGIVYLVYDYPENAITASNVVYDNGTSKLKSTEIQGAIDELNEKVTEGELKTARGTSIHVTNSKEAPCLVNTYGNTTQNGTPTPTAPIAIESTVLSEIRTCGKNLAKIYETAWTVSNNYITNKIDNSGRNLIETLNLKANTTYYINLLLLSKPTASTSLSAYIDNAADNNHTFSNINEYNLNKVYTYVYTPTQDEAFYYKSWGNANSDIFNFQFWISTDETNKTYEPYTETVATLPEPITLNGLGNVKDYIDMKRGVLVQKFNKFVADSSMVNSVSNYVVYIKALPTAKINTKALCTHDENVNASGTGLTIYFKDEVNGTSAETYKAFLDSNEVEFMYELAEPIETPLSEANIKALRALKSFNGITNAFNNANAEMDFIYATTDNAVINMENNNKFGDFITIVKAETNLENASSGNFTTMLSEIIPSGYKVLGITNICAKDTSGEIAGQIRVQADIQSVDYTNNRVILNCNVYTGTSNPVSGTITFELLMIKR